MCERPARMVRTLNTVGAEAYHATISPNSSNDLLVGKNHNTNSKPCFNPIRSLEPKHILFYYRADCLALVRRRSGLRQATKTDKMPIRK